MSMEVPTSIKIVIGLREVTQMTEINVLQMKSTKFQLSIHGLHRISVVGLVALLLTVKTAWHCQTQVLDT